MLESPSAAQARELVLDRGWNSTSFQIVNPGMLRWFTKQGDAVVGFVEAGRFRVVAGAPVCTRERLPSAASVFEAEAADAGQSVCYFAAEARLESVFSDTPDHAKFLIGAQPVWHPAEWPEIVRTHRSLRAQLNRARNKGVTVREWPGARAANNPELHSCLMDWLRSKGLPPLHFMVEPETLSRLEGRRIFVAEQNTRVIGFVVLSPVAQRNGWLFEQFPHRPGAPNGTVELMIDTAMRALATDGCDYATLGLAPLSTRAEVEPFANPVWLRIFLAWLRKHTSRFYNFDGLDAFKAKLRPRQWEPVFVLTNKPRVTPGVLYAIAHAFSGGHPFRLFAGGIWRAFVAEIGNLNRLMKKAFR